MVCVVEIKDGDVTEWFMGQSIDEVCDEIENRRWRDQSERLEQLWQELCTRAFTTSGKYHTISGHILLIE